VSLLITADWVLPVSSGPLRHGAVLVQDDRVEKVGLADELALAHAAAERFDFPGCSVTPGLVNAHTHLALTASAGLLPTMPFAEWLARVPDVMRAWGSEDLASSAALGAAECLAAGVTTVGDIGYGFESLRAAQDAGLHGVLFWEVLGTSGAMLPGALANAGFPLSGELSPHRLRAGLSPHTAYTSGPGLLRAMHALAAELHVPFAIHIAESAAEDELMRGGTGPLADVASRLAPDFEPPGCGPVPYLAELGVLDDAIGVHLCEATEEDVPHLVDTLQGAVICPRSNVYLHNRTPPVSAMIDAGVVVGVGTDSAASNADLDLMEDVRAVHALAPTIPSPVLLEMATVHGARVLGLDSDLGALAPGAAADLAVFGVTDPDDPERAVVANAGAANLAAVMTAGRWRTGGSAGRGALAARRRAAEPARVKARRALEGTGA
jgi:cytosine/adenosine deaminase-related metal-dependent hydrolase